METQHIYQILFRYIRYSIHYIHTELSTRIKRTLSVYYQNASFFIFFYTNQNIFGDTEHLLNHMYITVYIMKAHLTPYIIIFFFNEIRKMYFSIKTEDMLKSLQMVFFYLLNNFSKRPICFKRVEYVMKNVLNMFKNMLCRIHNVLNNLDISTVVNLFQTVLNLFQTVLNLF